MKSIDTLKKGKGVKHIPISYIIAFHSILISITIFLYWFYTSSTKINAQTGLQVDEISLPMRQIRNSDYNFIKPLRLTDIPKESSYFQSLKSDINMLIFEKQKSGEVNKVSVYFRIMNDGSWFCINNENHFRAGSLLKVPIMIYYLKQAESHPSILTKKMRYSLSDRVVPDMTFKEESIKPGVDYTIKELISSMIMFSDNYATSLLNRDMNTDEFFKVFTDLGIVKPQLSDINYSISATDYSKFFRVLYSATYLNAESSEFALTVLSNSSFKEGILKTFPENLVVAHKFGEVSDITNSELSECAIVYLGDHPYLLSVMISGNDLHREAIVMSEISALVYKNLKE